MGCIFMCAHGYCFPMYLSYGCAHYAEPWCIDSDVRELIIAQGMNSFAEKMAGTMAGTSRGPGFHRNMSSRLLVHRP